MLATLFLVAFMLLIPKKFKKVGIKMIIEQDRKGLFLFILSKVMWWTMFLQISSIWIGEYMLYAYLAAIGGISYQFFRERKYIAFPFVQKRAL